MKRYFIYVILGFYLIASLLTILLFNGTGDSGDSINHYLFARYAPLHPELFFDHWAKPLFVLLASPFAQFGFNGIKVFNVMNVLFTIYFTFRITGQLKINNAILGSIILIFSPLYFILTFSGLTEPLFALILSIGLFLTFRQKYIPATILLSFLPFVRSEGLIIVGIFGIYLFFANRWKYIPILLVGHIVYSIAGYFVHEDFFWIISKIPYASLDSVYGSGQPFHFIKQLIFVVGVPIYVLFWIGFVGSIMKIIKKKATLEFQVLVFANFFTFLIAHSLFWYFGLFNSMGLLRVFIAVMPLISIIAVVGFNLSTEDLLRNSKIPRYILQLLLLAYIIVFPFTSNPAAIHWENDMNLSKEQEISKEVVKFLQENTGINHRFVYAYPTFSIFLNIDHFDQTKHFELTLENLKYLETGDIILWDSWFARTGRLISKEILDNNNDLIKLFTEQSMDDGQNIEFIVYQRK
jgi:hypothetical protein